MIFKVQGSVPEPYVVDTEKITCTCPQFIHRCSKFPATSERRYCKHLMSVFQEHPEVAPLWYQAQVVKAEYEVENLMEPESDGKFRYVREFFDAYVYTIKSMLNRFESVQKFELCGSYRRQAKKCSDLDVLIMLKPGYTPDEIFDYCENTLGYELIQNIGRGQKKAAYMVDNIVHVDFKIISEESWPFATLHFTGSKEHNILMRQRSLDYLHASLSEYGFKKDGVISSMGCKTEEDIFKILRMPYKEPWDRK